MGGLVAQMFPGNPAYTESDVPSLAGKVFIVTGGNSGIGLELVKILYSKGGTVYIAARSPDLVAIAIKDTKSTFPTSTGCLKSLHIDLSDLTTVKACASAFLEQESRLDVLWNNAGISNAPFGSLTVQGHEMHMGTNCLGPFLLTNLLLPILRKTARSSPKASTRVVFLSSGIIDMLGPKGGLSLAELDLGKHSKDVKSKYSASKAGNWMLASEFDKRIRNDGIVCVALSPGTLKSKGVKKAPLMTRILMAPFMNEPKLGAYTELWGGLSEEVKLEDGGRYAIPWGKWHPSPRQDVVDGLKTKEEGGTGLAAEFWAWCEERAKEEVSGSLTELMLGSSTD